MGEGMGEEMEMAKDGMTKAGVKPSNDDEADHEAEVGDEEGVEVEAEDVAEDVAEAGAEDVADVGAEDVDEGGDKAEDEDKGVVEVGMEDKGGGTITPLNSEAGVGMEPHKRGTLSTMRGTIPRTETGKRTTNQTLTDRDSKNGIKDNIRGLWGRTRRCTRRGGGK